MGRPFPSKFPFPMGVCGPNLIHNSLGPSKPTNRTASRSVQPFLHSSRHSVPIFYNGPPLPPQNWPFSWGSGPNLMHGSLGSPKSSTQTASCLVELFLQDRAHYCDKQTDRPTDRPCYSVCNSRPHQRTVRSTATRLNNVTAKLSVTIVDCSH